MRSSAGASLPTGDTYEALIFDWDGTLVDSRRNYHRALEAALRDCGVTLDPGWYWQRQGVASRDLLAEWEQTVVPIPEPIDTIINRYRTNLVTGAPTLKIIDEMADVARQAHQRSQPLAIGSNSTTGQTLRSATVPGWQPDSRGEVERDQGGSVLRAHTSR